VGTGRASEDDDDDDAVEERFVGVALLNPGEAMLLSTAVLGASAGGGDGVTPHMAASAATRLRGRIRCRQATLAAVSIVTNAYCTVCWTPLWYVLLLEVRILGSTAPEDGQGLSVLDTVSALAVLYVAVKCVFVLHLCVMLWDVALFAAHSAHAWATPVVISRAPEAALPPPATSLLPPAAPSVSRGEASDAAASASGAASRYPPHPSTPDHTCAICQEAMYDRSPVSLVGCGHVFCGECICTWVDHYNASCPVCRHRLQTHNHGPAVPAGARGEVSPWLVML
jgi:hypothetical protein